MRACPYCGTENRGSGMMVTCRGCGEPVPRLAEPVVEFPSKIGQRNLCHYCGAGAIGYFAGDEERRLVCRACKQGLELPQELWICRRCGCTTLFGCRPADYFQGCNDPEQMPVCEWVAPNLCSACVEQPSSSTGALLELEEVAT